MKLVHNTPIKLRTDYRFRKRDDVITTIIDSKRRVQRTEKPDTTYFIWFLSLKLLLEMEKLGLGLQKRKEVLIIGKDIKIDKNYYKEWELNEVLKLPFHKWWKTHKNLFEVPLSVDIAETSSWTPKPHYRFMRVDIRNNYTTIMKDIRKGLEDLKGKETEKVFKYGVSGESQYKNDIVKYNIMVRFLRGEEDLDIFKSEKERLEKIENKGRSGQLVLDDDSGKDKGSKLWWFWNEWNQLSSEEKKVSMHKIRIEDRWDREEGKVLYERELRTSSRDTIKKFRSVLRDEVNRLTKDYQKILYGVSQGKFRKMVKF